MDASSENKVILPANFMEDLQRFWRILLRSYGCPPEYLCPDKDGLYHMQQNPACKNAVVNLRREFVGQKQNKTKERIRGIGTCFLCKKEIRKEDCQKKTDGSLPNVVVMYQPGKLVKVFACLEHPGVYDNFIELVDLDAVPELHGRPGWECGHDTERKRAYRGESGKS